MRELSCFRANFSFFAHSLLFAKWPLVVTWLHFALCIRCNFVIMLENRRIFDSSMCRVHMRPELTEEYANEIVRFISYC